MDTTPPQVPGIEWQVRGDLATAIDLTATRGAETVATAALAIREVGPGEHRANISGSVDPNFRRRGIGSAILRWAETTATHALSEGLLSGTLTLAANAKDPDEGARALFASAGLSLAVAEDELHRHLTDIPKRELPVDVTARHWDDSSAPLFFHAYDAAFRDRPGFPNWDEPRWRSAFTESDEFRPDLSTVILDGPEPVAYAVIWVEESAGWVTQMGVRPQWRGRGFGEALLARSLHAFAAEGLESAALEVATNNPKARALYERMGFTVASTYESWRKKLR